MNINISAIKQYYDQGLWSEERIRALVENGRISIKDFTIITGKYY